MRPSTAREPEIVAALDKARREAAAKRAGAEALLAEADRLEQTPKRVSLWLDRITGRSKLGHFPYDQMVAPAPPEPFDMEAALAGGANHHTGPEGHLDDLVCDPGYVSLATLAAGAYFGESEWAVVEVLHSDPPGFTIIRTAADLHEAGAPLLAEALLHATGEHGKRTHAEWAEPYMQRWRRVRKAIAGYRGNGVAISMGDITLDAHEAYMTKTGINRDELFERYPPRPDGPLPACVTSGC